VLQFFRPSCQLIVATGLLRSFHREICDLAVVEFGPIKA